MIQPTDSKDEAFDETLSKHLRHNGDLFPRTADEIEHAIDSLSVDPTMPEKFADPFAIIDGSKSVRKDVRLLTFDDSSAEENLAQAARDGGNIPSEIKARMAADRKAAENNKGTNAQTSS